MISIQQHQFNGTGYYRLLKSKLLTGVVDGAWICFDWSFSWPGREEMVHQSVLPIEANQVDRVLHATDVKVTRMQVKSIELK